MANAFKLSVFVITEIMLVSKIFPPADNWHPQNLLIHEVIDKNLDGA